MMKDTAYIITFILVTLLIFGCQKETFNFQVISTGEIDLPNTTYTQDINNCFWIFPIQQNFIPPDASNLGLTVTNLVANGGEPFTSIRQDIYSLYSKEANNVVTLTVPAGTRRKYILDMENVAFQGVIVGESMDQYKIEPTRNLTYHYPFIKTTSIKEFQDIPCN